VTALGAIHVPLIPVRPPGDLRPALISRRDFATPASPGRDFNIFTAEVIRTAPGSVTGYGGFEGPGYRVYLRIIRSFKGRYRPGDKEVYATFKPGGACGIPVAAGQQFLVYGSHLRWFLGMCNSSTGDQMTADVAKLDAFIAKRARR
jgi:hypothetical protein